MRITAAMAIVWGVFTCVSVSAGPVIIDGTDAIQHGSQTSGVPEDGWLYIQKGFERMAALVGNGNRVLAVFTRPTNTSNPQTGNLVEQVCYYTLTDSQSRGQLQGWSLKWVTSQGEIQGFFANTNTGDRANASETGIIFLGSDTAELGNDGGLTAAMETELTAQAANLADFVGPAGNPASGGGLFGQAQDYQWLKTLIPNLAHVDYPGSGVGGGLSLTMPGQGAFPGLQDADLSTGNWHNSFAGDLGSLIVLATSTTSTATNVILGGGAGTTIGTETAEIEWTPDPVTALATVTDCECLRLSLRNSPTATAYLVITSITVSAVNEFSVPVSATAFTLDPTFDSLDLADGLDDNVISLAPGVELTFDLLCVANTVSGTQLASITVISNDPNDSVLDLGAASGRSFSFGGTTSCESTARSVKGGGGVHSCQFAPSGGGGASAVLWSLLLVVIAAFGVRRWWTP